jgi:RES domain-containing protein
LPPDGVILWRISNHASLDGEGGRRAPGRWHSRGRAIVYCTQSPAAALLEILVHARLTLATSPVGYRLLQILAPPDAIGVSIEPHDLPPDWVRTPLVTRRVGDAWLSEAGSPMLMVPSAVVAKTTNVLINPLHPAAAGIEIVGESEHVVDRRLLL